MASRSYYLFIASLLLCCFATALSLSSESNLNERKTILFHAVFQKSPIIALQGLAEEMVERGYRVIFAATDDDRHYVTSEAVGVEFLSAGSPPPEAIHNKAHTIEDLFRGEGQYARSVYDNLLPKLANEKIDLVVFDPLSIAGEAIAHHLGVPSVSVIPHLSTLAWLGSEASAQHPMIASGLVTSTMTLTDRLKNAVLIFAAGWVIPALKGSLQNDFRQHAGLPAQWFEFQNPYGRTKLAIVANPPGFEHPQPFSSLIRHTGPILPRASPIRNDEEKAVVDWLATDDGANGELPVVFVSIGTNADHTADSANALLELFIHEAVNNSAYRVVWSIKKKHQALLDPTLLAQHKAATPDKQRNLLISSFVPQLTVLENHSTKLFLSHCGLSSLLESLYFGVPLLCCPMMLESDQPTNAGRVQELGLGVWLDRRQKELTPADVSSSLNALMKDDHPARAEAQRWRGLLHKMKGRCEAADWLEMAMHPLDITQLLQPAPRYSLDVWAVFVGAFLVVVLAVKSLCSCCCRSSRPSSMKKKTE